MKRMVLLLLTIIGTSVCYADAATNSVAAVVQSTNATARVQCWAQTKSGNRCKRRAVCGERYCRQHSATIAPKKPLEKCRSFTDGGKPCDVKPVDGCSYCERHFVNSREKGVK